MLLVEPGLELRRRDVERCTEGSCGGDEAGGFGLDAGADEGGEAPEAESPAEGRGRAMTTVEAI